MERALGNREFFGNLGRGREPLGRACHDAVEALEHIILEARLIDQLVALPLIGFLK